MMGFLSTFCCGGMCVVTALMSAMVAHYRDRSHKLKSLKRSSR
jgi:hypothetical protein